MTVFAEFAKLLAVSALLLKITGSGVATGLGIVCTPLPGIAFSVFAGNAGDRARPEKLITVFSFLRGAVTLAFIFCKSGVSVITLMLVLSAAETICYPSANKLLASMLKKDDIVAGNAVIKGGYGAASLVTPLLSGYIISIFGINSAFFTSAAAYFIAGLCMLFIKIPRKSQKSYDRTRKTESRLNAASGFSYVFSNSKLKSAVIASSISDFATASVNIAFYSFAFDRMKVSAQYWGMLLSVLYGMNVVAMYIIISHKKFFAKNPEKSAALLLLILSAVWCADAAVINKAAVTALSAAEGICSSMFATLVISIILSSSGEHYAARVSGVQNVLSSAAKLTGACLTYAVMKIFDYRFVFISGAAVIFAFSFIHLLSPAASDQSA